MATSLAQQLKQLRTDTGNPSLHKKSREVSLLFESKQAANIDLDTLHSIGLEGISELKKSEERFAPFEHTLFSKSAREIQRELQTKKINQQLDESIDIFLDLLSPYFLLQSAHKAFEYLLRRYR